MYKTVHFYVLLVYCSWNFQSSIEGIHSFIHSFIHPFIYSAYFLTSYIPISVVNTRDTDMKEIVKSLYSRGAHMLPMERLKIK